MTGPEFTASRTRVIDFSTPEASLDLHGTNLMGSVSEDATKIDAYSRIATKTLRQAVTPRQSDRALVFPVRQLKVARVELFVGADLSKMLSLGDRVAIDVAGRSSLQADHISLVSIDIEPESILESVQLPTESFSVKGSYGRIRLVKSSEFREEEVRSPLSNLFIISDDQF